MSSCSSCGAPIVWAVTPSGHRMPLDADPVPAGNLVFDGELARHAELDDDPAGARWVSHFATCPESDQWRRRSR